MTLVEKGMYFLMFVYLARTASISEYGIITAIFVFANLLNSFLEFGFAAYFQREAAYPQSSLSIQLNTVLTFKAIVLLLYCFLVFIYYSIVGTTMPIAVTIISLSVYIISVGGIFMRTLFGLDRYDDSFYSLMFSRSIVFLGIGVLFFFNLPYQVVLLLFLFSMVTQIFFLTQDLKKRQLILSFQFDLKLMKHILVSSLPMGLGISMVWIYDKMDVLFISHYLGNESVSFYAVAYSLYKIPQIISAMVLTPLYTSFSIRFSNDRVLRITEITKPAALLIGFALVMILLFNIMPERLLYLSYGEKYISSGWILGALSFALPGLFLNNLTGVMLNSVRNERKAMYSTFYGFLMNISLNIFLLTRIGLQAAVFATICTEYCVLFIQIYYLKKSKRIVRKIIIPISNV